MCLTSGFRLRLWGPGLASPDLPVPWPRSSVGPERHDSMRPCFRTGATLCPSTRGSATARPLSVFRL